MAKRRGIRTRLRGSFPGIRSVSVERRSHAELDRSLDQGERLSLTVDVPPPVTPVLDLHQLGIQLFELFVLVPLPKGPLRRPVNARVGIVAVEIEQFADQRLPLTGRQSGRLRMYPMTRSAPAAARSRGGTARRPSTAAPGRDVGPGSGRSGQVQRRSVEDRLPEGRAS